MKNARLFAAVAIASTLVVGLTGFTRAATVRRDPAMVTFHVNCKNLDDERAMALFTATDQNGDIASWAISCGRVIKSGWEPWREIVTMSITIGTSTVRCTPTAPEPLPVKTECAGITATAR